MRGVRNTGGLGEIALASGTDVKYTTIIGMLIVTSGQKPQDKGTIEISAIVVTKCIVTELRVVTALRVGVWHRR